MVKKRFKYTPEHHQYLRDHVHGTPIRELANNFNEHFDLDLPWTRIRDICNSRGYRNGLDTSFKPKQIPHNKHPIGTTLVSTRGYKIIKVSDTQDQIVDWRPLHHILWEFFHGKIDDDSVIVFLDQDKTNIVLSNLAKVDRGVHTKFAPSILRSEHAELNQTLISILEIDRKVKDYEK